MSNAKFAAVIDAMNRARDEKGLELGGKKYSQVKDRVETFRREFGGEYGINTKIVYHEQFRPGTVVVARAEITDGTGVVSTGHSMDWIGSSHITETAAVESVETAAVGRALAFMGFAGGEFPSDSEMSSITRKQQAYQEVGDNRPPPPAPMNKSNHEANLDMIETRDAARLYMPSTTVPYDLGVSNVIDAIKTVGSIRDLTAYWNDLKRFREDLGKADPVLHSEMLAAFATVKNGLIDKGEQPSVR